MSRPVLGNSTGFTASVYVYFDELDAMGLLHNVRYGFLVERALLLLWDAHGYGFSGGRPRHPDASVGVAEYSIVFRSPVRGTGEVQVQIWVDRVGETSVTYGFRVLSPGGATVHATGRRVHIRLDPETLRPRSWADETRAIYEQLTLA